MKTIYAFLIALAVISAASVEAKPTNGRCFTDAALEYGDNSACTR